MRKINITCRTCHKTWSVNRTNEIPKHVFSMGCNWCPDCEDKADDYYEEWYNESDDDDPNYDPIPPNQLCLTFVIDEFLPEKHTLKENCYE